MKREIRNIVFYAVGTALMLVAIGFTSVKNTGKSINDVVVEISEQDGQYFTDPQEILNSINPENTDYILGLKIDELDLKDLERRVEQHPFVKESQVYRDVKGNLMIRVIQARPIARIINRKGADQYIDSDGRLLPTSARRTARVPLIELERSFSWESSILETEYGGKIMKLLKYIETDAFWKAQIAQIVIHRDGELTMLPQVTKQEIAFGMPNDFEGKFKKLKVFYKEILPNKGWNTYSLVNLKFKNQIVCE